MDLKKFRIAKSREDKLIGVVSKIPVYGTTGVVAISETLVYAAGGLVFATLVCSPIIAIEVALADRTELGVRCVVEILPEAIKTVSNGGDYYYTKNMMRELDKPRIIHYDELSLITRKNAECLLASGEKYNVARAARMMQSIRRNPKVWKHVRPDEKARVNRLTAEIKYAMRKNKL